MCKTVRSKRVGRRSRFARDSCPGRKQDRARAQEPIGSRRDQDLAVNENSISTERIMPLSCHESR